MDESKEPALVGVDVPPKLLRLAEHLDELHNDDRQFIVHMLEFYKDGKMMPAFDIPRIISMHVPGEAMPTPTLLQDEMVSVESKYLAEVIWQYMPLAKFFAMLSTKTLHFSTLSSMLDPGERILPERAREQSKAQLREHFRGGTAGISFDDILTNLEGHRNHTVSITCFFMSETDSLEMWRGYAPNNGVAIKTTVRKLFSSLRKINETNIHIGRVIYTDPTKKTSMPRKCTLGLYTSNTLNHFRKKRGSER